MSEEYEDVDNEEEYGDVDNEEELEDEIDRGDEVEDDESDESGSGDEDESGEEEDESESDDDEDGDDLEDEEEESTIPRSRLNEVIAQREAEKERSMWLEEQLEKLIEQSSTPKSAVKEERVEVYNFSEAEENYASFLIEGDTSKASALRVAIDAERKKEIVALIKEVEDSTTEKATSSSKAEIESAKFDNLVVKLEGEYAFLDADSDDYNNEAVDTVNALLAGYVAAGKTKSDALKLAVTKVSPMYEEKKEVKQSLGNKKKVRARKKAAKASNAQPNVTTGKRGSKVDPDEVNISKMSEKAFNNLTLKERKALRGD